MNAWRVLMGMGLLVLLGAPVALPLAELWNSRAAWSVWTEHERLVHLAGNTIRLAAGTLLVAMPAGTFSAVLLYRSDLPGRQCFRFLVLLALFVPLPLFASAWQATLGAGGLLPLGAWTTPAVDDPDVAAIGLTWKPWAVGLPAAAWIHGVAALPWVILIVGLGLRDVDDELEEEALTAVGPWRVVRLVTLPQARLAVAVAAIWVVLGAATEITITDMLQVRTIAEEVYYQFVLGDDLALARSVAVALPLAGLLALPLLWLMSHLERRQAASRPLTETLPLPLGASRWPCFVVAFCWTALLVGVPFLGLLWKLGVTGQPPSWQLREAARSIHFVFAARGSVIGESMLWSVGAGVLAALVALVSCWLALESRWFRFSLLLLVTMTWALPAPVLGLGLKSAIAQAMDLEEAVTSGKTAVVQSVLYDDAYFAPIIWTSVVRFFPFAVVFLWPFLRRLPEEWRESARLEGIKPAQELCRLVLPICLPVTCLAALSVAMLSLGEVSASKLAAIPGTKTFAHELFNQMHYGVTNHLAALALILLAAVGVSGALLAILLRLHGLRARAWSN